MLYFENRGKNPIFFGENGEFFNMLFLKLNYYQKVVIIMIILLLLYYFD